MSSKLRKALAVIAVTALALVGTSLGRASLAAAEQTPASSESDSKVTYQEYRALFNDLEDSDTPRTETTDAEGVRQVTFEIDGFEMTLADVKADRAGVPLGGGWDLGGPYVTFNRTDQAALINGGGAALAAAICLIPAVGQVGCAVAAVIVAVATTYLNENGRCPGDLKLYIFKRTGTCV